MNKFNLNRDLNRNCKECNVNISHLCSVSYRCTECQETAMKKVRKKGFKKWFAKNYVRKNETPGICKDCKTDISNRGGTALRCKECQRIRHNKRQRKGNRTGNCKDCGASIVLVSTRYRCEKCQKASIREMQKNYVKNNLEKKRKTGRDSYHKNKHKNRDKVLKQSRKLAAERKAKRNKNRRCLDCDIHIGKRYPTCIRCKKCQEIASKEFHNAYMKKNKEVHSKLWKKKREELSDEYLKQLICTNDRVYVHKNSVIGSPLKASDITPEMIEIKRKQITLKRALKTLKNKKA